MRSEFKLKELNYVPNPFDGYKYASFKCIFRNSYRSLEKVVYNNIFIKDEDILAMVVLSAWMVKYPKGFGVYLTITKNNKDELQLLLHYKNIQSDSEELLTTNLNQEDIPKYAVQAIQTLWDSLENRFKITYKNLDI